MLPYIAWVQVVLATIGSLYFSEVLGLTPCTLCWYQRVLMYPLVGVIAVGLLRRDRSIAAYVLPLTTLGLAVSGYHNLLYYGALPEVAQPCRLGVSCTARQIEWLGFVTIPLMSMTAFAVVTVSVALFALGMRDEDV